MLGLAVQGSQRLLDTGDDRLIRPPLKVLE
jgi:hypothetical protein